jgi:tripartite-type tricarboxylate transporter receptor subunit TctC
MNKLSRRNAIAGLSAFLTAPASAQARWPSRPIIIVHGFAAGSGIDATARLVADGLSKKIGQPVIVQSTTGAAGTLAAGQVARAAPDGYTLLVMPSGHAVAAATYKKLRYRTLEDFTYISSLVEYPLVVVTYPDHPMRTLADLVNLAQTRSTPLLFGSPGYGSLPHLSIELLGRKLSAKFQHVPYRGSGASVTDLLGRHIEFTMDPPGAYMELVRDGRLRAIAVSGSNRFFALPEVPTIAEAGIPGFAVSSWVGLAAPAGMSGEIVRRINSDVSEILQQPSVVERLKAAGNEPKSSTPEEFRRRVAADIEAWTEVVASAGIDRVGN